jgi:hypothetical protein
MLDDSLTVNKIAEVSSAQFFCPVDFSQQLKQISVFERSLKG